MRKSNKYFDVFMAVVFFAILTSGKVLADDKKKVTTYQTLPNSSTRDWSAPSYVTETDKRGNTSTYQTLPSSSTRDWRAPSYVTEVKKK